MKQLSILLLVVISITASAQTKVNSEITKTLTEYSAELEKGNVDTALGYMYPKFYDVFPRNVITNVMKSVYNDTTLEFSFSKMSITNISKPVKSGKIQYALVNYDANMKMVYKTKLGETEAQEKDVFDLTTDMVEKQYGKGNVVANFAERSYVITMHNQMFTINDPAYGNRWWFIERKDELKQYVINKVIPEKVWDKLAPAPAKAKE